MNIRGQIIVLSVRYGVCVCLEESLLRASVCVCVSRSSTWVFLHDVKGLYGCSSQHGGQGSRETVPLAWQTLRNTTHQTWETQRNSTPGLTDTNYLVCSEPIVTKVQTLNWIKCLKYLSYTMTCPLPKHPYQSSQHSKVSIHTWTADVRPVQLT